VPRAAHSQYESKRIESEVIATKSLKKGVLTLVTRRRAVTPAGCRQRAKLGLASHGVQHGSSFMGPLSSLSIPLPVFLGPMVTSAYPRAGKGVRVVRYLRGVWVLLSGVPHAASPTGPLGPHQALDVGISMDLLQVLGEVPEMGRFGKGCIKYKTLPR
jgi:hypothetical protein